MALLSIVPLVVCGRGHRTPISEDPRRELVAMPCCGDLASAAQLALPLAVTSELEQHQSLVPDTFLVAPRYVSYGSVRGCGVREQYI